MATPEIIGSIRVDLHPHRLHGLRGKGNRVRADGNAAARTGAFCHPSLRQDAGAAPWRCRALRIEGHRHLSRSELPGPVRLPLRSPSRRAHRAMGLAGQHRDRPHPRPDLPLRLYRAEDRRWRRPTGRRSTPSCRRCASRSAFSTRRSPRTGYLVGEEFTFADINLLPILHRVRQAPEGLTAVASAKHLSRYYERHATRPSFERTDPPAGPPRRARSS